MTFSPLATHDQARQGFLPSSYSCGSPVRWRLGVTVQWNVRLPPCHHWISDST